MESIFCASLVFFLLIVVFGVIVLREVLVRIRWNEINSKNWDKNSKELVYKKEIFIGMDKEMAILSWGRPSSIDQVEVSREHKNERWVYGTKGQRAKYLFFSDGKLTKYVLN